MKNIIISGLLTNLHEFVSEQHFYGSWTPVSYNLNDFNEEMKNIGFELKLKKKSKVFWNLSKSSNDKFPKEYQNAFKYDLIYKELNNEKYYSYRW